MLGFEQPRSQPFGIYLVKNGTQTDSFTFRECSYGNYPDAQTG